MKWSGLYLLSLIGAISFAVSFDHVHQLFVTNGQGGWVGWALAIVVELLAAGSGLELIRRARADESALLPLGLLLLGAGMTLWGNLATAQPGRGGHLVAAFPAAATLGILATLETARMAAAGRERVLAEAQREARELAQAEAQRLAAAQAQAEAQRRAQEQAQRAEADRLRRAQEEAQRRSELPPPPVPGTEAHAIAAALSHRAEHGELPGPTELSKSSGTSLATAKRALKKIRDTPHLYLVQTTA